MRDEDETIRAWSEFVRGIIGDMPYIEVSARVGVVNANTIANWAKGKTRPTNGDHVVQFARAFGVPVPDALVNAGIGDEGDYSGEVRTKPDMSTLSMVELLQEMGKRVELKGDDPKPKRQPRGDRPSL